MSMGVWEYASKSCINEFNGTAAITTFDVKHESLRLRALSALHEPNPNQFHKFTANAIKCFSGFSLNSMTIYGFSRTMKRNFQLT